MSALQRCQVPLHDTDGKWLVFHSTMLLLTMCDIGVIACRFICLAGWPATNSFMLAAFDRSTTHIATPCFVSGRFSHTCNYIAGSHLCSNAVKVHCQNLLAGDLEQVGGICNTILVFLCGHASTCTISANFCDVQMHLIDCCAIKADAIRQLARM